jgi:hypothetical protein
MIVDLLSFISDQDALGYIFRKIGPYIALGRPGEELPELGSSKFYAPNEEWQSKVRDFLDRAQLVIFSAGMTDSLKWELAEIIRSVSPAKILIILPVRKSDYFSFIHWANSVLPVPLPPNFPSSRLVMFDDDWIPTYLPRGRTLTESLGQFFQRNGIAITESYIEKFQEHNGIRW